jgi:hypothetical protein
MIHWNYSLFNITFLKVSITEEKVDGATVTNKKFASIKGSETVGLDTLLRGQQQRIRIPA